jgi:GLPGLI family protein
MRKALNLSVMILLFAQFISAQGLRVIYEEITTPPELNINRDSITNNQEIKNILGKRKSPIKSNKELLINKNVSIYCSVTKPASVSKKEEIPITDGNIVVNSKIELASDGLVIYKNIADGESVSQMKLNGKNYIVDREGALKKYDWTTENERKIIAGYECIKATTNLNAGETPHEIIAWYAPDIPIGNGPMYHWGLPGLILGIETGKGMFVCNCISIETIENMPEIQKPEGEKISPDELNKLSLERLNKRNKRKEELKNSKDPEKAKIVSSDTTVILFH